MKTVRVELGERSYDVIIGQNALADAGRAALVCRGRTAVIVSNPVVAGLYEEALKDSLSAAGFKPHVLTVPAGEEYKTLDTVRSIYDGLLDLQVDRRGAIFALGGGVVGDMAGLAAATYLRGIEYVQIPTTLLAQVDASVGGKTGVDLPRGKNLVGAFYQPKAVVIDVSTLRSLPEREFRAGLAEVVKHGIITDLVYFEFLEAHVDELLSLDPAVLEHTVTRSVEIKADVVTKDERETTDLRKTLNLGHTFAHGLEAATGYAEYLHGEAVALGLAAASDAAETLGIAEKGLSKRVGSLLDSLGLPVSPRSPVDVGTVLSAMQLDKKVAAGRINFVLPKRIGEVVVTNEVPMDVIESVLRRWA